MHRWNGERFQDVGEQPLIPRGVIRRNNLVFDSQGVAYTAFLDHRERVKRPQVMAFAGGSWRRLPTPEVTTGGTWSDLPLYVHNDDLYLAYIDSRRSDGAATSHGMPVVIRYDGAQWLPLGAPDFNQGADVGFLRINVAPHGDVFAAFEDRTPTRGGSGFAVSVMRFRDGSWSLLGARRFRAGIPMQMLFDADGNPVVLLKTGNVSTSKKVLSLHRYRLPDSR